MQTAIVIVLFSGSVLYLWYLKEEHIEPVTSAMRWGVVASKHVITLFIAVFGANAAALLLLLPVLLYGYWTHTETGMNMLSALMDRPYFPLQMAMALVLGLTTFRWLRGGGMRFVWILPALQAIVAVAVFISRFHPKGWEDFWAVFFDWGCGCSATLLQWTVMLPLYTSVAFAMGAAIRGGLVASRVRSAAHA
jgi:hypothetical protein